VEALAGVSAEDAAALKRALNIKTIGDLGRNTYIVAAVAIAALADTVGLAQGATAPHASSEDELIRRHMAPAEDQAAIADARLVESGVPVWALAGYAPLVDWDAERIAADYALSVDEVAAALAYYRRHRDVIEARIAANAIPAA
jgi:uncharacterized protein (DUF433 family)